MDCGIPFCHHGCPLGNLIPEWNDLVRRGDWAEASERLHATNNFPEFTGRLCPAPCEPACVLAINQPAVTIKNVEAAIADQAWERGYVAPRPPAPAVGQDRRRRSAPARPGWPAPSSSPGPGTRSRCTSGLTVSAVCCATGSPSSGWRSGTSTGGSSRCARRAPDSAPASRWATDLDAAELRRRHDAVVVAVGAMVPRELPVPGRELAGIHQAMEYLPLANQACAGGRLSMAARPGQRGGPARGHRRRRRHRRGLPGHGAAPGRGLGYPAGHQPAAGSGPGPGPAVAGVPEDLSASPPPTRRPASWPGCAVRTGTASAPAPGPTGTCGCSPRPRSASRGTRTAEVRALHLARGGAGAAAAAGRAASGRSRPTWCCWRSGFTGPEPDSGMMGQLGLRLDARGNFARDDDFGAGRGWRIRGG